VYFLSLAYSAQPQIALAIIFAARLLTGVSESFLITAILSWGIARVQPEHAGKVIGWVGVFLFAAYGVGAPMGVALHQHFGFAGIAGAALLLPFAAGLCLLRVPGTTPSNAPRPPFYTVLGAVKLPGLGLTLCSVGYAMVTAFVALLFVQRGWGSAAIAFTSMGAGFILARLPFGHLPDKVGGARVAFTCVLLVGAGQLLVWLADAAWVACAGTALTGAGYALAFQGFGVEAVRRAPPQSRGAALGGYVAFQDIAMGLAAPVGGLLAHVAGLQSIYLFGAVLAFGSALVAWRLRA